jgi:hypothetical protein
MNIVGTIELEHGFSADARRVKEVAALFAAAGVKCDIQAGQATVCGAPENVLAAIGVLCRVALVRAFSVQAEPQGSGEIQPCST